MEKRKTGTRHYYHYVIAIAIGVLYAVLVRYPIVFLGGWYELTRWFYILLMLGVVCYGVWLFRRLRMRYVAIVLISIVVLVGVYSVGRFSLPFDAECDVYPPTRQVCFMGWVEYDSLTYAHWNEVTFFYTLGDLPVGIWYRSRVLE